MCDPVTATYVLMATAGGLTAYSQVEQGQSAKATAKYNAREMQNQAINTRNKGTEEENIQRQKTAELISRQRAQLGANGVDIDSGSAADLQQDSAILGEVDALRIRTNFTDQADTLNRQSELTLQQGKAAARAGNLAAFGTVLTTAASMGAFSASPAAAGGSGGQALAGSPVDSSWYDSASAFA
jgi:hypothetical protein